jgi:hypothetical protein
VACDSCPHGELKRNCAACRALRAERANPSRITPDPEIDQAPFTIRGFFGIDD